MWPSVSGLRDTALLLAALVLVAALADGELVKWVSGALIVLFALLGIWNDRGASSERDLPLSAILAPLFVAIAIATVFAEGEWFYVAIFALAMPLLVLTRIVLSLWYRRDARRARGVT